jgi:hypothetical protein
MLMFLLPGGAVFAAGESVLAPTDSYERIRVEGVEARQGMFDPSLEYAPDGSGWLAYSRVTLPQFVETLIAKSTDRGRTWQHVAVVNPSLEHSLPLPDGKQLDGVWRFEVPALAYDPGDAPARRWKLVSHQYFTLPPYKRENRRFDLGWISLRSAPSPQGPWSKPLCLFGSKPECNVDPNTLHPDLRAMQMYSEPGMMVYHGTWYVSLDASTALSGLGEWERRRVILLASDDHGRHWRYVNTLTDGKDASSFGYLAFTGSSLVAMGGRPYLLVSPSGRKKLLARNRGHDGSFLIAFEDIEHGTLERDERNRLVVRKWLRVTRRSGGLADYDPRNTGGGAILSQIVITNRRADAEIFQLFNSHVDLRQIAREN